MITPRERVAVEGPWREALEAVLREIQQEARAHARTSEALDAALRTLVDRAAPAHGVDADTYLFDADSLTFIRKAEA